MWIFHDLRELIFEILNAEDYTQTTPNQQPLWARIYFRTDHGERKEETCGGAC